MAWGEGRGGRRGGGEAALLAGGDRSDSVAAALSSLSTPLALPFRTRLHPFLL
jgi:hypothetical protein